MKIAFIATYHPQECGIATFTENLLLAVSANLPTDQQEVAVIAIQKDEMETDPNLVKFIIRQDELEDYSKAADFINDNAFDLCIIQHEYGIFGGDSGAFLLTLVNQLDIPFIVTAHTVLKNPSLQQRSVMKSLASKGEKLVVMSNKAHQFLRDIYEIPDEKIFIIEHGVPQRIDVDRKQVLTELNLADKKSTHDFRFARKK